MFRIDKQTLSDLNALDWNSRSLLRFFNHTLTVGGSDMLYSYFLHPLDNVEEIRQRQEAITQLADWDIDSLFDKYMMIDLERYLGLPNELHSDNPLLFYLEKFSSNFMSKSSKKERILIKQSVAEIAMIILNVGAWLEKAVTSANPAGVLKTYSDSFKDLSADLDMEELKVLSKGKNPILLLIKYDYLFRNLKRLEVKEIFTIYYNIDALRSVAKSFDKTNMSFPDFSTDQSQNILLQIKDLYNLALENPVKNNITVENCRNIWFLTGANMTGKSTLLKSMGASIYLAHMGFPVPAKSMQIQLFRGLMTTINLGDNLASGYSHFFNEVYRVKRIAESIRDEGKMIVMFDELFKGTNYEDSYEATRKLIESISKLEDSIFIISSHITELEQELKNNERVTFKYLKTTMQNGTNISFTYQLTEGVDKTKLGMWFLEKEDVFNTFKEIKSRIF
ncbi:MutS-related protein [Sphingobacterium spiritivorum]|uniref:MutS-related protein n=1 Tax=Sphingobacterium spiritivorum TaxID=258 RepID=UPI003DA4139C